MSSDPRRILITGCSGGGKSTLLAALAARGLRCVAEPGRRIIANARAGHGGTLPWDNPTAFAREALHMARQDFGAAKGPLTLFDRGLIDAATALCHLQGGRVSDYLEGACYDDPVFLAPPWPEIFVNDPDRPHGFAEAQDEFQRIKATLDALGYRVVPLPLGPVAQRVDHVLSTLR